MCFQWPIVVVGGGDGSSVFGRFDGTTGVSNPLAGWSLFFDAEQPFGGEGVLGGGRSFSRVVRTCSRALRMS